MDKRCEHKWVDMEDGSLRKFCVKCAKFAKQAQMALPVSAVNVNPLMAPAARETMQVPFYTGSKHTRVTVDKEKFLKEMYEEMGLGVSLTANLTNSW